MSDGMQGKGNASVGVDGHVARNTGITRGSYFDPTGAGGHVDGRFSVLDGAHRLTVDEHLSVDVAGSDIDGAFGGTAGQGGESFPDDLAKGFVVSFC